MIQYIHGNLFNSNAQVIVNPVNTVGVMGKGLALEFRKRYPAMFRRYRYLCACSLFKVGQLWLYPVSKSRAVMCFPTKACWWNPSKLSYIVAGLKKFANNYRRLHISSIAFPELGAGCGGLDAKRVNRLVEHYLGSLPGLHVSIYIYK